MPILEGKEEDGDSGDGEDDARQDESDAGDPSTDQSDEGPLPDLDSVTPLSDSHPPGQDREFKEARKNAREKLASYPWAAKIEEEYLGAAVNGVVYIFLFKICPARAGINSWIWVIEGDLPYAYLTGDRCTTPGTVLEGYIGAMEDWVEAARTGKSVAKLIPVNVPPTPANAESLGSKLKFLKKEILPLMQE